MPESDGEQFAVKMERKIMHLLFSPALALAHAPALASMVYLGGGLGLVVLIVVIVLILR